MQSPLGVSKIGKIGVLAVQGDFQAHLTMLERAGALGVAVRSPEDLVGLSGLILPGGESTTFLKFFQREGFFDPLRNFAMAGGAMFGTCAGAILLARQVANPSQESLGLLDVDVTRNYYGRQNDSFVAEAEASPPLKLGSQPLEAVFIRAPAITRVGDGVTVLAKHGDQPVLVQQGKILASTFHPELTADTQIHEHFLTMARSTTPAE